MTPTRAVVLCLSAYFLVAAIHVACEINGMVSPTLHWLLGIAAMAIPTWMAIVFKRQFDIQRGNP